MAARTRHSCVTMSYAMPAIFVTPAHTYDWQSGRGWNVLGEGMTGGYSRLSSLLRLKGEPPCQIARAEEMERRDAESR